MLLSQIITLHIQKAVAVLFNASLDKVELQATRKDFEGDITFVIFPLVKQLKSSPAELGNKIGQYLTDNTAEVAGFNVVAGFLNIVIADDYYINFFNEIKNNDQFGFTQPAEGDKAVMVEFASPNTNKPLHLGHLRNILLGWSVSEILKASGKKVYKTQIINDRGIHICKSMLIYNKYYQGQNPDNTGVKGDKLIGKYYVEFDKELKLQTQFIYNDYREKNFDNYPTSQSSKIKTYYDEAKVFEDKRSNIFLKLDLIVLQKITSEYIDRNKAIEDKTYFSKIFALAKSNDELSKSKIFKEIEEYFKPVLSLEKKILELYSEIKAIAQSESKILREAQQMLLDWEAGDEKVVSLWKKMNGWVYEGFNVTYKSLDVNFDKDYYESNTYLLGKDVIEHGLANGVFEKDPDGSVWIDLTAEGLDRKIVLRSDGTSVYITQDIGTAIQRIKDFPDVGGMVYTVGNEQDYHFKVLFLILKKLGFDWAQHLYHLSYGMVDLPSGKMKSREGTVVDADDLMDEMAVTAKEIAEELGKLDGYSDDDKAVLYKTIGMGALKYYILKVDPKKRILFNPEESVDFAGNTGPFIQYTYARIQSLVRRADFNYSTALAPAEINLHEKEKQLLKFIAQYPEVIKAAADSHSPALVANYTYDLVKEYNSFYQTVPVLGTEVLNEKIFRIQLSKKVGEVIKSAFGLLGIGVPDRM